MDSISLFFFLATVCQCQNLRGLEDSDVEHHPHHKYDDPLCNVHRHEIQDWCTNAVRAQKGNPDYEVSDEECWYVVGTERTQPQGKIAGHEIGRNKYPIRPMTLSPPPEVEFVDEDGQPWALGFSLHGDKLVDGKVYDTLSGATGIWVQPREEFRKTFISRLDQIDYQGQNADSFNHDMLASMVAGVGMPLDAEGKDTYTGSNGSVTTDTKWGKIFPILFKFTQANPDDGNIDPHDGMDEVHFDPADVKPSAQGIFRPCAQSYDFNQTSCDIDTEYDTKWPTPDNAVHNTWEACWMYNSWDPNGDCPFPFTGQGWTFDWHGYRDYIKGGCKASTKEYRDMIFGVSEMVLPTGTDAKFKEDPYKLTPLEFGCKYCRSEGDKPKDEDSFACPEKFMKFKKNHC